MSRSGGRLASSGPGIRLFVLGYGRDEAVTARFEAGLGGNREASAMKELPPDLELLDVDELGEQGAVRDDRLTPLFRRWPELARHELQELRRLYAERLRIARYVGERRRKRPHG